MFDWFFDAVVSWLAGFAAAAVQRTWDLLAATALVNPDVTGLPQVATISGRTQVAANAIYVLVILAAGVLVMTHETVQIRYGIGELAPRLVIGLIAANLAMPLCSGLISVGNAFTGALTDGPVAGPDAAQQVVRIASAALNTGGGPTRLLIVVIVLLILVLTVMLLLTWMVRLGVLVVLAGIAPAALACHGLPQLDGVAHLWWRSMLATLGTVTLQAFTLHTGLSVFLAPDANLAALGLPGDPTGVVNLFIVVCLLWTTVKIPSLMARYATHHGGRTPGAYLVRAVLVQQLARAARLPLRARP